MKVIDIPIKELKPYGRNAKLHPQKQIDLLAQNISRFGFTTPILIDENNEVIAGHGRLLALQQLGATEAPAVRMAGLSEKEVKALRISDNKIAEMGTWNMDLMIGDLSELDTALIELTGFDPDLLISPEDKDNILPEKAEAVAKLGDLFLLGEHRILCGDSTSKDAVTRLMDKQEAELLFTSPPYSDMRVYNGDKDLNVSTLAAFIPTYERYCAYQVINLGIQRKDNNINEYWQEYIELAKEVGYKFLSWNVWEKNNVSIGNQTAFIPIYHEWLFVFGKENKDIKRTNKRKSEKSTSLTALHRGKDDQMEKHFYGKQMDLTAMKSVFHSNSASGKQTKGHPATFPVELPLEYIGAMTNNGDLIVDPFMGSGTTLIAAEKSGRRCYGMELDPKYVDLIVKRWEEFTGKKAVLTGA